MPTWNREADFLLVQVSFESVDRIVEWRQSIDFDGAVLPAVLVLASAAMADRVTDGSYEIDIPSEIRDRLLDDPTAGISIATDQLADLRTCGAFQGAHLIAGTRYRQVAQELLRYFQCCDDPAGTALDAPASRGLVVTVLPAWSTTPEPGARSRYAETCRSIPVMKPTRIRISMIASATPATLRLSRVLSLSRLRAATSISGRRAGRPAGQELVAALGGAEVVPAPLHLGGQGGGRRIDLHAAHRVGDPLGLDGTHLNHGLGSRPQVGVGR